MAGVFDAAKEIDVAEVYDAFSGAEIQGVEALGLAAEGQGGPATIAGEFDLAGRIPINLSGGLMGQGGSPGSVGIAQAITVSRLLTQTYHQGIQPTQALHRGVIDTHGGVATVCVVHVLEKV